MKPKFVFFSCLLLTLCGHKVAFSQAKNNKAAVKPVTKVAIVQKPLATTAELEEGRLLISKSDCVACHNAENKMVGPSYSSIAQKYTLSEANVKHLAQKVISGGSGVWGDLPMPPHPNTAPEDLHKMVKYILFLKAKS